MIAKIRLLLFPFSLLYGLIIRLRNFLFDRQILESYKAEAFVISLGNLTTGGTGKTPMAEYLFRYAQENKIQAAYLSRGYGRRSKGFRLVDPATDTAKTVGDEALQIADKFPDVPVAVCEKRADGINSLQKDYSPQWIILDDAFQHRQVARDLDWVLIDANRPPQKDFLLPAGNLREPLSGLKRADAIVVNKINDPAEIPAIRVGLEKWGKPLLFFKPEFDVVCSFCKKELRLTPANLAGRQIILFSGIANHHYFEQQIRNLGAHVIRHFAFRDHYRYQQRDIDEMVRFAKKHTPCLLLTTEKDFYRLKGADLISAEDENLFYYVSIRLVYLEGGIGVLNELLTKNSLL